MPRQLHHVVFAAILRRVSAELARQNARVRPPKFEVTDTTGAIGAFAGHFIPKVVGDIPVALVPGHFIETSGRDYLRCVRIHMQAFELIATGREGIEETLLIETPREAEILLLPGHRIQIGKHLAHAAILHLQHALHLLFAERVSPVTYPTRHPFNCVKRLLVARKRVHVEMTGHDLVIGVEGGPNVHAVAQTVEPFDRERAEIAILVLSLTSGQLRHHEIAVALQFFVIGTGEGECARRKVLPTGKMTAQFAIRLLPLAKRFCGGGETGRQPESMEQPVRRQRFQIFPVGCGRRAEWSLLKPHVLHRKRTRLQPNHLAPRQCRSAGRTDPRAMFFRCGSWRGRKNSARPCHGSSGNKLAAIDFLHGDLRMKALYHMLPSSWTDTAFPSNSTVISNFSGAAMPTPFDSLTRTIRNVLCSNIPGKLPRRSPTVNVEALSSQCSGMTEYAPCS